ncbi:MAG: TonB-dependent receptor [Gammaproteobacteria bacterium]
MKTITPVSRMTGFRLSLLAAAVATHSLAAANDNIEHITVVGQAASIDAALKEQRNADTIKSVVHADGIAQLPDDNAAEALQRIPGVSVERDQGEGRFVSVRGLGPDLNSVTINGTLVPAPEADRRAVALDVLPSELVQSLSVVKSLTPDMDANSLGGTIEVESLSAFDHDGLFATASSEASYDDNTGETSPKLSGAISDQFSVGSGTNNLGIALAVSWQERDFGSDNVETGGAWDFDGGAALEELELRDYLITRKRAGVGLNLDFKADNDTRYYLRSLFSQYTDTETRQAAVIEFEDAISPGQSSEAEAVRELKDREETQEVTSIVLGGEKMVGLWTLNAQAGFSEASEDSPRHIASAEFASIDPFSNASFSNTRKPRIAIGDEFYQASSYTLDAVEQEKQFTEDQEHNLKLDLARDYDWNGNASQLKFGGKVSRREKTNDLDVWNYEDFGDAGFSDAELNLDQFTAGSVDYALGSFGPAISASAVNRFLQNASGALNEEDSRIDDFTINEDIDAAYVMNSVDIGAWHLIAGVRYEGTELEAEGTQLDNGDFSNVNVSNDYDHWLPGLHARYQLNDQTQVRMAWTNVVVRPTFEQLAPGIVIDGDEYSAGNPNLDPLESANIDLGIEHFMGRAGMVALYGFYKNIDNFIYTADIAGTSGFESYDEAITFANGDSADLYGIELAYSQKLATLPAPWNGLLLGANLTLSKSEAKIGSDTIDLPNQSDEVGNLMLGWENDRLSLRLSANYKSDYLAEVADESITYADAQTIVDFSGHYFVTPDLQVRFEALNITDEPYYAYVNSAPYNAQYEEYGPTYKIGLTYTRF